MILILNEPNPVRKSPKPFQGPRLGRQSLLARLQTCFYTVTLFAKRQSGALFRMSIEFFPAIYDNWQSTFWLEMSKKQKSFLEK